MANEILIVDESSAGVRLDIFLTQNLPDVPSRSFVRKLIDSGQVKVNGIQQKPHYQVEDGDELSVEYSTEILEPQDIQPEQIVLDILYEDDDVLVLIKPTGMLVHPDSGHHITGTLVNALLYHCQNLSDINSAVRPGIVHRLDRETSGVMVVAKNNNAHANLAKQFARRKIRKKYVALVEGSVEFDEGIINEPIGRHHKQHDLKQVSYEDSSKEAITMYRVLKRYPHATLMALYPQTGRTHQLRVHMKFLRHPILGDDKYGRKSTFPRLALHAQSLSFFHPANGARMEFCVPMPSEFLLGN